jgi:alginate O-acetyltransferase complex protein AlgI
VVLFTSRDYLFFLVVVFVLYWVVASHRLRVWMLLVASFGFYASWNRWLALVVCVSASLDWLLALAIEASPTNRVRRMLVGLSVAANLGLLCYFKYANFFLDSLAQTLRALGAETSFPVLSVILPIGISFYTFEAISYVVDVYHGRLRAERNLANFLLFILFFPHLVAGPIVRGRDFLPQVRRRKIFSWYRVQIGVQLILLGLLKKWVIADRMALFADPVFANPLAYKAGVAWIGVFAYALQVYADFSGYTDMALGSAHLLGYHLAPNFRMPYLAPNITELWRRWHISLSSWLRDYLFIPLGGNRGGALLLYRNLLLTMTLCGLWHGASWNFVLFGLLQGVFLLAHKHFHDLTTGTRLGDLLLSAPGTVLRIVVTFTCFAVSLVVFRGQGLAGSRDLFTRLGTSNALGMNEPLPAVGFALTLGLVLLLDLLQPLPWRRLTERAPPALLGAGYATALCLTLCLAPGGTPAFIYFQF